MKSYLNTETQKDTEFLYSLRLRVSVFIIYNYGKIQPPAPSS